MRRARRAGTASGLAFPGHFLIRLSEGPERLILDPFHGGQVCDAAELRELLKATAGQEIELPPEHYAPVSDRDVLLRLQNNLKARLLQAAAARTGGGGRRDDADAGPRPRRAVARSGSAARQLGNMRAAAARARANSSLRAPEGAARHQAAALLQQLRSKLN